MKGSALMKAVNAVIAAVLLVLLAVHGLGNSLQLFGVGSVVPAAIGWALAVLAAAHLVIGVALTVSTLREQRRAGTAYWRLNRRFWAVRFSGLAIAVFVVCHILIFARLDPSAPVRLSFFGPLQLAVSLLLAVSLAVHVLDNLQPLLISLGVPSPRGRAADLGVVFALILLVAAIAFVVYFIRWSVM